MKKWLLVAGGLLCALAAFAVKVDEKELEEADARTPISFESYNKSSKHDSTLAQIKAIGQRLGLSISKDRDINIEVGDKRKYSIAHALDTDDSDGMDADIIEFGEASKIDHIKNVRRVISAYLSSAYEYEEADADMIAILVTVYNGLYRGNINFFNSKYKKVVTQHLEKDKVGLALNYKEWPGKTQIVIPLSNATEAGINSVDLGVITSKKVVSSLEGEDAQIVPEVKTLRSRAVDAGADFDEDIDGALWPRVLLLIASILILAVIIGLLVRDVGIHNRVDEVSSQKELLISDTDTESYVENWRTKKSLVTAGGVTTIFALLMTALATSGFMFVPIGAGFTVIVVVLLLLGAVAALVLLLLGQDFTRRLEAVSSGKVNPAGNEGVTQDPTVATGNNDPTVQS